jgi:hypothetical protein
MLDELFRARRQYSDTQRQDLRAKHISDISVVTYIPSSQKRKRLQKIYFAVLKAVFRPNCWETKRIEIPYIQACIRRRSLRLVFLVVLNHGRSHSGNLFRELSGSLFSLPVRSITR